ncbi:hypothetical protein F4777DRAFT_321409 [Nemania sp. FL0916]|nr:hypothetical protein F4777DRAFT_321409 [Nemania sp. FL0916]
MPYHFLKGFCLGCIFPSRKPSQPPARPFPPIRRVDRADYYNARVRAGLGHSTQQSFQSQPPMRTPYDPQPRQLQSQPQPQVQMQVQPRKSETVEWSTSFMSHDELIELFNLLHTALAHIPYAICGLGALIDHGYTGRKAHRIAIICSQFHTVKSWASAGGYEVHDDSIGFPTSQGLRRIRIHADPLFESIERVRSRHSNAIVVSLVSLLDSIAVGYLANLKAGEQLNLRVLANDAFVCLDLIATRRQPVNPRFLPTFLGEEFFTAFTARHEFARTEMARAGIDVSAALAKIRVASTLREHNQVLNQYGMQGDLLLREPGHSPTFQERDRLSRFEEHIDVPLPAFPAPVYANRYSGHSNASKFPSQRARESKSSHTSKRAQDSKHSSTSRRASRSKSSGTSKQKPSAGPGRSLTASGKYHEPIPVEKPGPGWI